MLPQHSNPTHPDRIATAPYNFVPLPETVVKVVESADHLPNHDRYDPDRKTGYFDVTLTTKAPVYVRCPFTSEQFARQERQDDQNAPFRHQVKNTPDFFYTRDPNQPVIPGSSLRGMLRSVLEVVSYGRAERVTDAQTFYRAVGDTTSLGASYRGRMQQRMNGGYCPRVNAGYLSRQGDAYFITPAEVIHGAQYFRVEEAAARRAVGGLAEMRQLHSSGRRYEANSAYHWMRCEVWFRPVPPITHRHSQPMHYGKVTALQCGPPASAVGWKKGVFVASGWIPARYPRKGKHLHWIIGPESSANPVEVGREDIEAYLEGGGLTDKTKDEGLSAVPSAGNQVACFYVDWTDSAGKQHITIGHTPFFRLPYERTPADYVPEHLRRPETVDYPDALFGFVRTKDELRSMKQRGIIQEFPEQGDPGRAYAGRVFITDAALLDRTCDLWFPDDPVLTPQILASPKPTAFQHYLVQTEPNLVRTGQYRDGSPKFELRLRHYDSPTPSETVIRGHKRYWHQRLNESEGLSLYRIRQHIEEERQILAQLSQHDTQHTRFKPVKPGVQFEFRVHFENLSDEELGALCWTLHPLGDGAVINDPSKGYCHSLGMGKPLGMGAVKLDATLHLTGRQIRYESLFNGKQWQTGANAPENLACLETLKSRVKPFEDHLLGILQPNRPCEHLRDLKRIAMLLKMMEWPGFRAEPAVHGQPSPNNRTLGQGGNQQPNTRYMTIELPGLQGAQKNEYRERPVLPDPSSSLFGTLTGHAVPTVSGNAHPNQPQGGQTEHDGAGDDPGGGTATLLPNPQDHLQGVVTSATTKAVLFDLGCAFGGKLVKKLLPEFGAGGTTPLTVGQKVQVEVATVNPVEQVIMVRIAGNGGGTA